MNSSNVLAYSQCWKCQLGKWCKFLLFAFFWRGECSVYWDHLLESRLLEGCSLWIMECIRLSARHSPGPAGSPSCRFIMLPGYVPGCPIWPGQIFRHTSHNASDLHIFSLDLHGFDRLRTEPKLWRRLIGQPWIMQEYVIRCPGVPSFCFIYTG
mgnify:CR=1 FL=1